MGLQPGWAPTQVQLLGGVAPGCVGIAGAILPCPVPAPAVGKGGSHGWRAGSGSSGEQHHTSWAPPHLQFAFNARLYSLVGWVAVAAVSWASQVLCQRSPPGLQHAVACAGHMHGHVSAVQVCELCQP